jgi:hypothetical protein
MELHAVADLIRNQIQITQPEEPKEACIQGRRRTLIIWGMILMLVAVAFGSSIKILAKEQIQIAGAFTPYLMVITMLAIFLGMGLMCYPFLQGMSAKPSSRKPKSSQSEATIKFAGPLLLAQEEPSVTERTTEFLEASEARIKIRDTAPQNQ